jgi:hypothetical protein
VWKTFCPGSAALAAVLKYHLRAAMIPKGMFGIILRPKERKDEMATD